MIKNDIYLPDAMEKDRALLEKSMRRIISIQTKKINDVQPLDIYESKFGGYPYFPKNMEYPVNDKKQPLALLAQINFEILHKNKELSDEIKQDAYLKYLPQKGILSFFIDYYDDLLGLDLKYEKRTPNDNKNINYKVIYFDTIETDQSKLVSDFSFLEQKNDNFYPVINGEFALTFQILDQLVTPESFEWFNIVQKEFYEYIEDLYLPNEEDEKTGISIGDNIMNDYYEAYSGGHQIGGYAFFTQYDPREDYEHLRVYDFLLLQIDSEIQDIMWGDSGVGNFFINFEELKKQNFNDVFYTWDCC